MKTFLLLILALLFMAPAIGQLQKVNITIKGLRNINGKVRIGVFKDNSSFEKEIPFRKIIVEKKNSRKGSLTCSVMLEPGEYGFALLDDENNNQQMDNNFFGIPLEGFGFSNYIHSGFFSPVFEDFKFPVKKAVESSVTIHLKYL